MPIALRLNMADNVFPTSQWTEAGATRVAPRVILTKPAFSGCSPMTARMADVSITISTITLYNMYNCTTNHYRGLLGLTAPCGPIPRLEGRGDCRIPRANFERVVKHCPMAICYNTYKSYNFYQEKSRGHNPFRRYQHAAAGREWKSSEAHGRASRLDT